MNKKIRRLRKQAKYKVFDVYLETCDGRYYLAVYSDYRKAPFTPPVNLLFNTQNPAL